eukprot:TRINITY_DN14209_c1_g2_i1.p1 TRINITY_DN14209_c1_g2~~TRINITY_DN14209_c1_g2_i1.p1  ORF type:complete len:946 (+),score=197.94 TRINITY_DN14209_c1_g2_i1:77-2914(+)
MPPININIKILSSFATDPLREPVARWEDLLKGDAVLTVEYSAYGSVEGELLRENTSGTGRNTVVVILYRQDFKSEERYQEVLEKAKTGKKTLVLTEDDEQQILETHGCKGLKCTAPISVYKTASTPYTQKYYDILAAVSIRRGFHDAVKPLIKVFCVDLDNTMWKGVVSEDANVTPFTDVQKKLQNLRKAGFLLTILSKNDNDAAAAGLEHPEMVLKATDFTSSRINWIEKHKNLAEMVEGELTLSISSSVFVDDNPMEIAEMKIHQPDVVTVLVSEKTRENQLRYNWIFDAWNSSVESADSERAERYANQQTRREEERGFSSYLDFVDALDMKTTISRDLDRFSQMSLRTNQFNSDPSKRMHPGDVTAFLSSSPCSSFFTVSASDKHGDHGIIGGCLYTVNSGEDLISIDLFMLSCRVLNRGIEHLMIREVLSRVPAGFSLSFRVEKGPKNHLAVRFEETIRGFSMDKLRVLQLKDTFTEKWTPMKTVLKTEGHARNHIQETIDKVVLTQGVIWTEPTAARESTEEPDIIQLLKEVSGCDEIEETDTMSSLGIDSMKVIRFISLMCARKIVPEDFQSDFLLLDPTVHDIIQNVSRADPTTEQQEDPMIFKQVMKVATGFLRYKPDPDVCLGGLKGIDAMNIPELLERLGKGSIPEEWGTIGYCLVTLRKIARMLTALKKEKKQSKGWNPAVMTQSASTGVLYAARNNHLAELQRSPPSEVLTARDKHGLSCLSWGAGNGHTDVVSHCLSVGTPVDDRSKDGRTPLMWACRNGHLQTCRFLTSQGADPHAVSKKGITCLHWAIWGSAIPVATWLISTHNLLLSTTNNSGCNGAIWGATAGSISLCEWLLSLGADFTHLNKHGHGVVVKAAWRGNNPLLEWIFDKTPVPLEHLFYQDVDGKTPIDLAMRQKHGETVDLLKKKMATRPDLRAVPAPSLADTDGPVEY